MTCLAESAVTVTFDGVQPAVTPKHVSKTDTEWVAELGMVARAMKRPVALTY